MKSAGAEEAHLETVEGVIEHLRENRDLLSRCVVGFSGGKDSVLMVRLIEMAGLDPPPLRYIAANDVEWPYHEEWCRARGAEVVHSRISWDWIEANPWAFMWRDARASWRYTGLHHRGTSRRLARDEGRILMWGNRRADGNTVPRARYVTSGVELWQPIYRLPNEVLDEVLSTEDWSPIYDRQCVPRTCQITCRASSDRGLARRLRDVHRALDHGWISRAVHDRFLGLMERVHPASSPPLVMDE